MAASGAPVRQPRRGPAPIASFDHDVSDESSPETKQTIRLPEIREDPSVSATSVVPTSPSTSDALAPPEQRARSHSTPSAGALQTAPRIDISRASSSSHHDSRDSSPELALFAGASNSGGGEEARSRLELGFREDGALDLRSSTEELAFLQPAPGEPKIAPTPANPERRHSRKDSQGSEAALLAVSGRTSRLSSVGSQCSAHSALSGFSHNSRVSRLSVVSGISRSPSPHKMLLETSFCGPKPIETDPEICAAVVEERLLEMAKLSSGQAPSSTPAPVDARDRREVRTEATVERTSIRPSSANSRTPSATTASCVTNTVRLTSPTPTVPPDPQPVVRQLVTPDEDKRRKESRNRARAEERRARSRDRRESLDPEVKKNENRSKDIIRIRLKPDSEYEEDEEDESERTLIGCEGMKKPDTLILGGANRPTELAASTTVSSTVSPTPSRRKVPRDSRTPSPVGTVVSRKSSFCSLFKSRETIASPDSPSDALRRKKSLTEGRSRSRSRDRSATPTSATKIRGSVLSLFRTPRKSATSPSPSSRDNSPVVQSQRQILQQPVERSRRNDKLKYYEDTKDGIIHIPLRTPPNEQNGTSSCTSGTSTTGFASGTNSTSNIEVESEPKFSDIVTHHEPIRPASAPHTYSTSKPLSDVRTSSKPIQRTVLPDGSIIIPLHSPTEKSSNERFSEPSLATESTREKVCELAVTAIIQAPPENIPNQEKVTTQNAEQTFDVSSATKRDHSETSISTARADSVAISATQQPSERRRKERFVFSTQVGSRDQVFSTQFSITKTPSVTSEISESIHSFPDSEEVHPPTLRDTHITTIADRISPVSTGTGSNIQRIGENRLEPDPTNESISTWTSTVSPQDGTKDSSESETSSDAGPSCSVNDVEQRGLVVQESFEDELPYVPTTLPLERSLALPMVPVRERSDVTVARVERPRATTPRAGSRSSPAPVVQPVPQVPRPPATTESTSPATDKIRIRLPRRPRTTSASGPSRSERARTRSRSDGYETRAKTEWIDFEEVPERRKQPKRIQTLPSAATSGGGVGVDEGGSSGAGGRDVVFSYVEPEECRCECHTHAPSRDDELPLLDDDVQQRRISASSLESDRVEEHVQLSVQVGRPFTADLDLHDVSVHQERYARHERHDRADRRQH
ncbi:serine/arginine repetitive matrix protein 2 isoform X2 [Galleria mellonella]|uniref:Serine/arginine repetitive matrix protein 2 isoform X2 n=1 Tax=Galleria mellonella TaxID=7137 RepID=A0A6J3C4V5_GALME|nr:serine/arginine repetitive matrix protein 2 isoform X2 [Galleria mellonella]